MYARIQSTNVIFDQDVKLSIEHSMKKKKKKRKILKSIVYCQRRSDEAGMYSVTGRVGIPDIKTDAEVLLFELANGTN